MAQLAIEGHPTRGSEVIALLEMLGGKNTAHFKGEKTELAYYIEVDRSICCIDIEFEYHTEFYKITIEEFEEKFPYKVGDKVKTDDGDKANIIGMVWDNDIDDVFYEIWLGVEAVKYPKELLQPYIVETITIDDFKANTKEWLIDKLHDMIVSDAIKTIGNIHDELHKPKYPKTYEECASLLNTYCGSIGGYNWKLLSHFQQLLVCRDAYWKIAGEQMGLGKPFEPDWLNVEQDKYVLFTHNNAICSNRYVLGHNILAFPTPEMRDAFYENFKELIENVKELL